MSNGNYMRLGDCIRPVDIRNRDMISDKPMGINIDKFFMPSVANVVGTDLSNYKVVEKDQFACNLMHVGRDERLPIAILEQEAPIIVSPAYYVFDIKPGIPLMPSFLMLWFKRPEFDRNAWFYTDADVRGGLDRDSFLDMEIPVPSIDEQRRIVTEYEAVVKRITTNEVLIAKLEDVARAIYSEVFIEKIDNEHLPSGWRRTSVFDVAEIRYGFPYDSELFCDDTSLYPVVRIRDILANQSKTYTSENAGEKYAIDDDDILVGMDGVFHMSIWHGRKSYLNQRVVRFRCNKEMYYSPYQLLFSIQRPIKEFEGAVEGTTVAHLGDKDLKTIFVLVASEVEQKKVYAQFSRISDAVRAYKHEIFVLNDVLDVLLSKMSYV